MKFFTLRPTQPSESYCVYKMPQSERKSLIMLGLCQAAGCPVHSANGLTFWISYLGHHASPRNRACRDGSRTDGANRSSAKALAAGMSPQSPCSTPTEN